MAISFSACNGLFDTQSDVKRYLMSGAILSFNIMAHACSHTIIAQFLLLQQTNINR